MDVRLQLFTMQLVVNQVVLDSRIQIILEYSLPHLGLPSDAFFDRTGCAQPIVRAAGR